MGEAHAKMDVPAWLYTVHTHLYTLNKLWSHGNQYFVRCSSCPTTQSGSHSWMILHLVNTLCCCPCAVAIVLWLLCCGSCAVHLVLWPFCFWPCAVRLVLWPFCCWPCAVRLVLWPFCCWPCAVAAVLWPLCRHCCTVVCPVLTCS